jgi:hypothetical protein
MGTSAWAVVLLATVSQAAESASAIKQEEMDYQNQCFQQWWEAELVWKFSDLPKQGRVPDFRIPYSGHDYPDHAGGTQQVMRKYDWAFHRGTNLAWAFEREDTTSNQVLTYRTVRGFFGLVRRRVARYQTPRWHGHCNGWTAAAIRHAEPQNSVTRNGVVFSPADIKALLADIYLYSETEFLGGVDYAINPGTLHVVLANWLGRGSHPVGMETTLGEVAFNYPIYAYEVTLRGEQEEGVEVVLETTYAKSSNRVQDKSPHIAAKMVFHYLLELSDDGTITGGRYYRDSAQIDMLWVPLNPAQGGEPGNERGNPHVDVLEVLAMWRESVPETLRNKWYNIDPAEEDRILEEPETTTGENSDVEQAAAEAEELSTAEAAPEDDRF